MTKLFHQQQFSIFWYNHWVFLGRRAYPICFFIISSHAKLEKYLLSIFFNPTRMLLFVTETFPTLINGNLKRKKGLNGIAKSFMQDLHMQYRFSNRLSWCYMILLEATAAQLTQPILRLEWISFLWSYFKEGHRHYALILLIYHIGRGTVPMLVKRFYVL